MPQWTLKEIAEATNGTIHVKENEEILIEGVNFDTRKLNEGDLFVPLVANRDGHDFIENAITNGAKAAFWSHSIEEAPKDFPVIKVKDTLEAFQTFAKAYLKKVNPKVVGITGSNGKTTTKDMVEAVLATKYKTHKTQGNFNNQIGLPVTILEMPADTEAVILEMGMDHAGEIHALSTLAEPDVAVITMVGEAHIEFFGSRKGIADAKLEILDGLNPEGTFIYSSDEPLLQEGAASCQNTRSFGKFGSDADYYPLEIKSFIKETVFTLNKLPRLEITLPLPGEYNVQNGLIALAVGEVFAVPLELAVKGLEGFQLTKNRLEWLEGFNHCQILNDAYNASPSSMKASLRYFSEIQSDGKKIAVLGDMLELGNHSKAMHEGLEEVIDADQLDQLILYGSETEALYNVVKSRFAEENIRHFIGDKEPMIEYLREITQENDVVFVKSSLGTDLLHVVKELSLNEELVD